MQETGRIGRDGGQSFACVLSHKNANYGINMSEESKNYVKLDTCRRKFLVESFGHSVKMTDAAKCCDICSSTTPSVMESCQLDSHLAIPLRPVREAFTSAMLQDLEDRLKHLIENSGGPLYLPPHISSHIYPELIVKIIDQHTSLATTNDLMELGCYSPEIALQIINILNDIQPLI